MSSQEQWRELMQGILTDRQDYRSLQDLLEQQFAAVLSQDGQALSELAEQLNTLLDEMQQRKQRRQQLVSLLSSQAPVRSMQALFATLPASLSSRFAEPWQALCEQVSHCKQLNERNGILLHGQHALYQRVLFGESDTYVAS